MSLGGGLPLRVDLSPGLHLSLLHRRLALRVLGGLALGGGLLRRLALRLGSRMGLGGGLTLRLDLNPGLGLRLLRRRLTLAVFSGLALDSGLLDRLSLRQRGGVGLGGRLPLRLDLPSSLGLRLLRRGLALRVLGRLALGGGLLHRLALGQGGGVGLGGRLTLRFDLPPGLDLRLLFSRLPLAALGRLPLDRGLLSRLGLLLGGGLLGLNGLLLGVGLQGVLSRQRGGSRADDSACFQRVTPS